MVILFLIALVLLGSLYAYREAFHVRIDERHGPDEPITGKQYQAVMEHLNRVSSIMQRYSYESVTIESVDGLKLHGRYYHLEDGAPLEILFHGYRSYPYRDCAGGHALSRKLGFNALVVDQRAHGDSQGRTITFGIKERQDCLSWVNWANERFGADTPIMLCGLSMGAATVLMSADLDLPQNVACIVADSPYTSPAAIIEKVCADRHFPPKVTMPFMYLGAWLYGRFRLGEASAISSVQSTNIPILLIHGEEDYFVPCDMSREIAANCMGPVQLQTFPGAGHGLCYITDPLRYEKNVLDFLKTVPSVANSISPEFVKRYYS